MRNSLEKVEMWSLRKLVRSKPSSSHKEGFVASSVVDAAVLIHVQDIAGSNANHSCSFPLPSFFFSLKK